MNITTNINVVCKFDSDQAFTFEEFSRLFLWYIVLSFVFPYWMAPPAHDLRLVLLVPFSEFLFDSVCSLSVFEESCKKPNDPLNKFWCFLILLLADKLILFNFPIKFPKFSPKLKPVN